MDIEATMRFIIDRQAQFSSDIGRINLALQRTNEILGSLTERQNQTEQNILEVSRTLLDVANAQQRTSEMLVSVAERQDQTEHNILVLGQSLVDVANAQERSNGILATLAEKQVNTEEAMRRLAERQSTTEENLNVLLLTVERHIANHN